MGVYGQSQFHSFRLGTFPSLLLDEADVQGNVNLKGKEPSMSINNYELGIVFPLRTPGLVLIRD